MIRFHGGPITPASAAINAWRGGAAMISFAYPDQIALAMEYASLVALDNGAFTNWKQGAGKIDIQAYIEWVLTWRKHPSFAWCLMPDVIDGTEAENTRLIEAWPLDKFISVPIWHMHESLEKLQWLVSDFYRVAIGSSGEYSEIGTREWWNRMDQAMEVACDDDGFPKVPLHGLRQMDNDITSNIPYSGTDSVNIARNIGIDSKWQGPYSPASKELRAMILRDRIDHHATASRWAGPQARNLELFG